MKYDSVLAIGSDCGMAVRNAVPKLRMANTPIHIFQSYLIVFQSVMEDVDDATLEANFDAFFVTSFAARYV
jgi:hypothetical protein